MGQKTILYLEDEEELAEEVIEELQDHGIKVIHSAEFNDGVLKARNQEFDMFLMDIHLKKGTGDKIIKLIRDNPRHPNYKTPMLVVSSHITKELVKTIGSDVQYALVKPFDLSQLLKNIFKILKIEPSGVILSSSKTLGANHQIKKMQTTEIRSAPKSKLS